MARHGAGFGGGEAVIWEREGKGSSGEPAGCETAAKGGEPVEHIRLAVRGAAGGDGWQGWRQAADRDRRRALSAKGVQSNSGRGAHRGVAWFVSGRYGSVEQAF